MSEEVETKEVKIIMRCGNCGILAEYTGNDLGIQEIKVPSYIPRSHDECQLCGHDSDSQGIVIRCDNCHTDNVVRFFYL